MAITEEPEEWDEVVFEGIDRTAVGVQELDTQPGEARFVYKRGGKQVGEEEWLGKSELAIVIERREKSGLPVPHAYRVAFDELERDRATRRQ
jgi:hypothetical protein